MNLTTTTCECCDADIHNVTIPSELITFNGEEFVLHLDADELTQLYFELKQVQCQ